MVFLAGAGRRAGRRVLWHLLLAWESSRVGRKDEPEVLVTRLVSVESPWPKTRDSGIVIGGARKEAALIPAIKANLFNVLITDAVMAKKLLEKTT